MRQTLIVGSACLLALLVGTGAAALTVVECVDAAGNVYTTAREGITVLSPDGVVLGTIEVPESPSNCCFGGDDFRTLFVTARTSLYAITLIHPGAKLGHG